MSRSQAGSFFRDIGRYRDACNSGEFSNISVYSLASSESFFPQWSHENFSQRNGRGYDLQLTSANGLEEWSNNGARTSGVLLHSK